MSLSRKARPHGPALTHREHLSKTSMSSSLPHSGVHDRVESAFTISGIRTRRRNSYGRRLSLRVAPTTTADLALETGGHLRVVDRAFRDGRRVARDRAAMRRLSRTSRNQCSPSYGGIPASLQNTRLSRVRRGPAALHRGAGEAFDSVVQPELGCSHASLKLCFTAVHGVVRPRHVARFV